MANEDEDFAALLAEYEGKQPVKRKKLSLGDLVRGRVISIGADAVFIDLGGKDDGVLDLAEARDADGRVTVSVGDELEARVIEVEPSVRLSRVVGRAQRAPGDLENAFEHQIPVEALVKAVVKGGVEVEVAGARGFCPLSQLDARHVDDPAIFVGQRLQFRITRLQPGRREGELDLVLSRRALLDAEAREKAQVTREKLQPGAVLRGVVTALKDFGAFVDLGGVEGLVHVSELGFQRVAHPKDVLAVGQEVEVQVKRVEPSDDPRRPERVSLSLKSLERDPWADAAERFPDGTRARGKIVRLESFGAFVELQAGVEGLLHIGELGGGRPLRHAKDALKLGDSIDVIVQSIDRERRRISLALAEDRGDDSPPPANAPQKLGTLGDLLRGKKKK